MFLRRVRVFGRLRRHPNVQIQAVLARCLLSEVVVDVVSTKILNALRRLAVGVVNSAPAVCRLRLAPPQRDRKSTRLNSSHSQISYAVFCLKKKNKTSIDFTK